MAGSFPSPSEVFQDRYRILSVINRGGFGRVYRASQVELNRDVAIKVLQPIKRDGMNADEEANRLEVVAKRFEREAQLVCQLRDSHTVVMHDYGTTDDGLLYMVLEYIDGEPLNEVIEERGALAPERVVKIARQVLSSLEEAHALNMLHRDVKPANIMLFDHAGRTDQVKVLDFGLAKSVESADFLAEDPDLTGDEVILGTPRYMSPEQIRGESLEPATDIYSLGLVLFEMLAGYKAVQGDSTMNTLARHLNEIPITLPDEVDVPQRLREIIDRMLLKDPRQRIGTAKEVLDLLDAWDSAAAIPSRDDSFEMGGASFTDFNDADQTRKLLWIGGGLMVVFLVIGVAFSLAKSDGSTAAEASPAPAVAEANDQEEEVVATRAVEDSEEPPAPSPAEEPAAPDPEEPIEEAAPADEPAEPNLDEESAADDADADFVFDPDGEVGEPADEEEPEAEKLEGDARAETARQARPERRDRRARHQRRSEPDSEKKSTNESNSGKTGGGIGLDIKTLE